MSRLAASERFSFHDLRSVSADGAATAEEARDRLGHMTVETTKRHYLYYLRGVRKAKPSREYSTIARIFHSDDAQLVRPDGFEPPTTWFEAVRAAEIGIFSIERYRF